MDRDKIHEECGVFGMYDRDENNVVPSIYYGLMALQHRGQEACGIAGHRILKERKAIYRITKAWGLSVKL